MLAARQLPSAFDAMLQTYQQQATQAQQLVALAQPDLLATDESLLSFAASLAHLEQLLKTNSSLLDQEEQQIETIRAQVIPGLQQLNGQLIDQQEANRAATAALQPVFAATRRHSATDQRQPLANKTTAAVNGKGAAEAPRSAKKKSASTKDKESATTASSSSGSTKKQSHGASSDAIRMAHVSHEEFETIPKYMRGRLELARLNSSIDAWTSLLREKYALLHAAKAGGLKSLSESQQRRFTAWADEETEETTHAFFLSTDDLRASPELQGLGSMNLKAVLVALRHLGRVKNSTAAGAPKYLLVNAE